MPEKLTVSALGREWTGKLEMARDVVGAVNSIGKMEKLKGAPQMMGQFPMLLV